MSALSATTVGVGSRGAANEKRVVDALRKAADQALRRAKSDMPTRVQFIEDMRALESAFLEKHAEVWKDG